MGYAAALQIAEAELPSKFISFPIRRDKGQQQSGLGDGMIPIFDKFTMLRADYDRLMKAGGEPLLRQWLLDTHKVERVEH